MTAVLFACLLTHLKCLEKANEANDILNRPPGVRIVVDPKTCDVKFDLCIKPKVKK